jgi:hypothetical protein
MSITYYHFNYKYLQTSLAFKVGVASTARLPPVGSDVYTPPTDVGLTGYLSSELFIAEFKWPN